MPKKKTTSTESKCRVLVMHTKSERPIKEFPFSTNGLRKAFNIANGYARAKSGQNSGHVLVSVRCTDSAPYDPKRDNYRSAAIAHCTRDGCSVGEYGQWSTSARRSNAKKMRGSPSANRPLAGASRRTSKG